MAPAAAPLRVGIIGTGCIGMEHMRNLLLLPSARIFAIADCHEPSRASAVKCFAAAHANGDADLHVLEDYQHLLQLEEVDAVLICTPNYHHAEVLEHVMAAGKHCLVEKPLAIHVHNCGEAVAAEGKLIGRALHWCAMEYRYIPTIARLIAEADSGAIGALRMLTIRENRFPFLRKVGNWNRTNARSGGTLVEKCCHFFDLMRRILRSEPRRIFASGGQDVNHLLETDGSASSADILDNAYVLVDFECGARAVLELCMFAEASLHQEEVSLIGTHGKLEAFAPSHGLKLDDGRINFRKGVRNSAFTLGEWDRVDPPPPEECGTLTEEHIAVDPKLLEAGNHAGATYEELRRFTHAALNGGDAEVLVSLADGAMAVLMGIAAQRSIASGLPVAWADMLAEFNTTTS